MLDNNIGIKNILTQTRWVMKELVEHVLFQGDTLYILSHNSSADSA